MSKDELAKIKNKVEKNYKVSKQVAHLFKDNSDAKDLSCWLDYKSINYLIKQAEHAKELQYELDVIGEVINSVDNADEINNRILEALEESE